MAEPAAGWFRDPSTQHLVRYWDGRRWTSYACDSDGHIAEEPSVDSGLPTPQRSSVRSVPPAPPAPPTWQRDPGQSTGSLLEPPLTYVLQGLLLLSAGVAAVAAALTASALTVAKPRGGGWEVYERWMNADANISGIALLIGVPVWLATFSALLIWITQAHRASEALAPGSRRWSVRWAIGGWFVPFAQFVVPKLALGEVERIASAPRRGGRVDPSWRQRPSGALGWIWWLTLTLSNLLLATSFWQRLRNDQIEVSPAVFRTSYRLGTLGFALLAASSLIAVLYVGVLGSQLCRPADRPSARRSRVQVDDLRT